VFSSYVCSHILGCGVGAVGRAVHVGDQSWLSKHSSRRIAALAWNADWVFDPGFLLWGLARSFGAYKEPSQRRAMVLVGAVIAVVLVVIGMSSQ
jgi:hypothetical protein